MTDRFSDYLEPAERRGLAYLLAGTALLAILVGTAYQQGTSVHEAIGELFLPVVLLLWGVQLVGRDRLVYSAATVAGVLLLGAGLLNLSVFFWQWPTADEVVVDVAMLVGVLAYLYTEVV